MWGMLFKSRNTEGDRQSYKERRREVTRCGGEGGCILRERRKGSERQEKGVKDTMKQPYLELTYWTFTLAVVGLVLTAALGAMVSLSAHLQKMRLKSRETMYAVGSGSNEQDESRHSEPRSCVLNPIHLIFMERPTRQQTHVKREGVVWIGEGG